MKRTFFYLIRIFAFFTIVSASPAYAGFTLKEGKIVDVDTIASLPVEDHYHIGVVALEHCDWAEAARQFNIVTTNFPTTTLAQDSFYYLGFAYFQLEEFEYANEAFSDYLKCHSNPQYFEEAVTFKFAIANRFNCGAKKRFFGWKRMPKWCPATSEAIQIYDEVIAAMPCHNMAAQAMFAKAKCLLEKRHYSESVDVYQQLIRRFPKHELAPESYLAISKVYLDQSEFELHNPDILAFAQINLRKYKIDFPRDTRIEDVEQDVMSIKEFYANALYETGLFYERKKHPEASLVYYYRAIELFPDTRTANWCQHRLEDLGADGMEIKSQG